ncbi:alpha/beta hydrolase, partial [Actinoplanes sp. NPDC051633]|uniref:alpha/beta hydrolase n=1 Tax=Actinoplanes sp. NPDC051633 TaxID=3155670 RepID=UPI00343C6A19
GRTIELALTRLPATNPERRIGSLFVNPGGPGNSGVEFVRATARDAYPADVLARFDIVGMDPRGVAASTPVRCFASESERKQFMNKYILIPVTRAEHAAAARKAADLAQRCHARMGWLLPHLSTANVARDLDRLRQAVGDRKLSYVGYSYGTYLGATYANMFPSKVRSLALDGNTDPPAYAGGPRRSVPFLRVNAHVAASETLDQFFKLCAQAGPRCDFAAGGDPRSKFAVMAQRLRENPVAVPGIGRVGYAQLVDFTVNGLYRPVEWAGTAATLHQLYAMTDPATIADEASPVTPTPVPTEPYNNVLESFFASVCSDTRNPADPAVYADLAVRADRRAPYVGAYWTYLALPCSSWTARDVDRYTGGWRVRTAAPALVLNNRFDPATGYRNAIRMAGLLPGSRLVLNEGWGHTVRETRSPCADAILARYLIDRALPPRGATCQPGIVPFAAG